MLGAPMRQEYTLAAIAEHLISSGEILGALAVGSLVSGAADA
jgi:hypothetical protein